ncbi:hypothetical protein CONCODRAFT_17574 [Conidiobolus coronatus NRRL 28638]|uniref:SEC7 domain-containing protein n=1 Tax=Conidiobolus coronatus (strain ATCC 28846 / CBS 209.66 / NRRL 28638) TaxID=796925 RepID=A0A137P6E9_CONC2|nr:hypothetical protein CONCODRAFT_17574 [Conidiobolus coronatus NRRL 28638]|eukprot:KXN70491.1 hypothetical protein CONCODRAFT_17574 [Conidiobolus coronatus NRRL 28638]
MNFEITNQTIEKLQSEAKAKKENELVTLCSKALEDLTQVKSRLVGGKALPPPPSAMEENDGRDDIIVTDTVSEEFIGDRYYKVFQLGISTKMPIKIQQVTLDALHKLIAHNLLNGNESWEYNDSLFSNTILSTRSTMVFDNGLINFDQYFKATEVNDLLELHRVWPWNSDVPSTSSPVPKTKKGYKLIDDLVYSVCRCYNGPKTDESIQIQVAQVLITLYASPCTSIHTVSLLHIIMTLLNMAIYSTKPSTLNVAKATMIQIVNLAVSRLEECHLRQSSKQSTSSVDVNHSNDEKTPQNEEVSEAKTSNSLSDEEFTKLEILKLDVLILLQFLCHFSMGNDKLSSDSQVSTALDARCRSYSLELILSTLNNSGSCFKSDERFQTILKRNLCISLSKNGIFAEATIFELSLSIFIVLFSEFRALLKNEIELLFKEIYIRLLTMSNSTYYQKSLILQAFMKICDNSQAIVDMYVNYDCHLGSSSVFEAMVSTLSKISQGRPTKAMQNTQNKGIFNKGDKTEELDKVEENWLRLRGLRCLVTLIQSLVGWSQMSQSSELPITPVAQSHSRASSEVIDGASDQLKDQRGPIVVNKHHLQHVSISDSSPRQLFSPHLLNRPSSTQSEDDPQQLLELSNKKQIWVQGVEKFNQNPKKGIKFLREQGFVGETSEEVASFLLSKDELSKPSIGEFLGDPDQFNINVMHEFVNQIDFEGLEFVNALRKFLQLFRLPGESQKIDRIMEKFADRYCETNPNVFNNADAAYVLAFSVIMLNTDQHSNQVRNKMDKVMFIRNNQGIDNGKNLPQEFLEAIFDDIGENEIIMESERFDDNSSKGDSKAAYQKEASYLQKKLLSLFQGIPLRESDQIFLSATQSDHVKPMFGVAWYSIIAALSRIFEEVNEEDNNEWSGMKDKNPIPEPIRLCLEGFSGAIRITSIYSMDVERNAFVSAMVKFTSLSDIPSIQVKHVACIHSLLTLAHAYGEYLEDSWDLILDVVSRLDQLKLLSDPAVVKSRKASISSISQQSNISNESTEQVSIEGQTMSLPAKDIRLSLNLNTDLTHLQQLKVVPDIGPQLKSLSHQNTLVVIDQIFSKSVQFGASSILSFYRALCNVSLKEMEELPPANPRSFSLQKIVEITYYNMDRMRLEWSQIWKVLRPYFNTVGCHRNFNLASIAVDSLRQLGMKFLERKELNHFHTQQEFMKPFEHIVKYSSSSGIHDLVLQSLTQMVQSKADCLKSGWKSLFTVLNYITKRQPSISVLSSSWKLCRYVLTTYIEHIDTSFVDGINCLVAFVINPVSQDIRVEALQLFKQISDIQLDGFNQELNSDGSEFFNEDKLFLKWFPILSGLSKIVIDCPHPQLKSKALNQLFDTVKQCADKFSKEFWKALLRSIVAPIFDDLRSTPSLSDSSSATTTTWSEAIENLVSLFRDHYDSLHSNLDYTDYMFDTLASMLLLHRNEKLTKQSLTLFQILVLENGYRFNEDMWRTVTRCLSSFFDQTTPESLFQLVPAVSPKTVDLNSHPIAQLTANELNEQSDISSTAQASEIDLNNAPFSSNSESTHAMLDEDNEIQSPSAPKTTNNIDVPNELFKCSVHLTLLQSLKTILVTPRPESDSSESQQLPLVMLMPRHISQIWLGLLQKSALFAQKFNEFDELRTHLWRSGYVTHLPHLIRQETSAKGTFIQLGFQVYGQFGDDYTSSSMGSNDKDDDNVLPTSFFIELNEECYSILNKFEGMLRELPTNPSRSRDLSNWSHLVSLILTEISNIPWQSSDDLKVEQLRRCLPQYHTLAVNLINTDIVDVRLGVQKFLRRFGDKILNVLLQGSMTAKELGLKSVSKPSTPVANGGRKFDLNDPSSLISQPPLDIDIPESDIPSDINSISLN